MMLPSAANKIAAIGTMPAPNSRSICPTDFAHWSRGSGGPSLGLRWLRIMA
jgi:hypothetical protein